MDATVVYPILAAFAVSAPFYPILIRFLRRLKAGQPVRDDGPQTHLTKAGTPTMGGLAIVAALAVASLAFAWGEPSCMAVLAVTMVYAAIGFADDYIKVIKRRSKGLSAAQKFAAQLAAAAAFAWWLVASGADLGVYLPFFGVKLNLGAFGAPLAVFAILGTVNGANFTDGLDGLAAGVTALICVFFLLFAWIVGSPLTAVIGAAAGALLAFLLFNSHPARVFMGDTGSLALGAFVCAVAIYLNLTLFLIIVAFVYLAEVASVMLQVSYFKLTRGKRLFRMAPLHHHFEKLGWAETKVVAVFYVVTAMLCLVGFLATNGIIERLGL